LTRKEEKKKNNNGGEMRTKKKKDSGGGRTKFIKGLRTSTQPWGSCQYGRKYRSFSAISKKGYQGVRKKKNYTAEDSQKPL